MCNTDHDYTAHLQRPGGKYKNVSTHYYTPETSDASSTTSNNDESVHLPDPPQLGKELLNENDSSDSNLSATLEKLSHRIGEVLNRLEYRPPSQSVAPEHVRTPVPSWMPPSLDAVAFRHNRCTQHTFTSLRLDTMHYRGLWQLYSFH